MSRILTVLPTILVACGLQSLLADDFRVLPYLQNPAPGSMTIRWFSESEVPGRIEVYPEEAGDELTGSSVVSLHTSPELAEALSENPFQNEPEDSPAGLPYRHTAVLKDLKASATYRYRVIQNEDEFRGVFRTAPAADSPIRLIVYSDSETEPESSVVAPVSWPAAAAGNRPTETTTYLVNQTVGYRENCRLIEARSPDLLVISGDLVECGGEQRDWDEFWRHNSGEYGRLASKIPILPALGNHENYAGPGGGYSAAGADFSTAKYLTYFSVPGNGASNPHHNGRYYRLDYGPVTLITRDPSDGLPHKTAADTNHSLEGSHARDFNPGSEQFAWLETQLAEAQRASRFTFVQFHHTMFGSGPHSVPFGHQGFSGQSGIAMRVLLPLFMKYGVDVVFSGHDEMLERSYVSGEEHLASGDIRKHEIHMYDVGVGGDGLRGPSEGFDNPYRKFLAHDDAPEVWKDGVLVSGGKHYGHLEVNVAPDANGRWSVQIEPVHVFPVMEADRTVISWERRIYDDTVTILQN